LQNVGIALKKLKITKEQCVVALAQCDEGVLTVSHLDTLSGILLSPEELANMRAERKRGGYEWSHAEDYLYLIGTVVLDARERIQLWKASAELGELVAAATDAIASVSRAVEVLTNKHGPFCQVLRVILAIGNYLNRGTSHGDATGFFLESLSTIATTKTADGSLSLVEVLVLLLQDTAPPLVNFPELTKPPIVRAKGISMQQLTAQISHLSHVLQRMRKLVEETTSTSCGPPRPRIVTPDEQWAAAAGVTAAFINGDGVVFAADGLPAVASASVSTWTSPISQLSVEHQQTREAFSAMLMQYGEDPTIDDCPLWPYVSGFCDEFISAREKVRRANQTMRSVISRISETDPPSAAANAVPAATHSELTLAARRRIDAMDF
jgi:hypothetical protein